MDPATDDQLLPGFEGSRSRRIIVLFVVGQTVWPDSANYSHIEIKHTNIRSHTASHFSLSHTHTPVWKDFPAMPNLKRTLAIFWKFLQYLAKFWTNFGKNIWFWANFHSCKWPNIEWIFNLFGRTQCDEIGRFLKVLGNKFALKSSPKILLTFGLFSKR